MSGEQFRQPAIRVFAGEFEDATHTFKEGEDRYDPLYTLLPSGARANRVLVIGTLTDVEDVGSEREYWKGRVVDPTGAFNVYAGEYEPEPAEVLRKVEPPRYVSVVGKPRTFETDEGDVLTSIRPEGIAVLDTNDQEEAVAHRNRWILETAEDTLNRLDENTEYDEMADEEYDETFGDTRKSAVAEIVVNALETHLESS